MITEQDLSALERLYTPLGKILLSHLREDHGHGSPIVLHQQQAKKILYLHDEVEDLISGLLSLKADYAELQRANRNLKRELALFRTRSIS